MAKQNRNRSATFTINTAHCGMRTTRRWNGIQTNSKPTDHGGHAELNECQCSIKQADGGTNKRTGSQTNNTEIRQQTLLGSRRETLTPAGSERRLGILRAGRVEVEVERSAICSLESAVSVAGSPPH